MRQIRRNSVPSRVKMIFTEDAKPMFSVNRLTSQMMPSSARISMIQPMRDAVCVALAVR